jgi:2-dehydro-3-deoxyphosphooctonate aldolase (KDO 8-P synthase)
MTKKMDLFMGPCVLESWDVVDEIAGFMKSELSQFNDSCHIHFKGSFDKANRTSSSSFRGLGIDKGLEILSQVKEKYGFDLITDFHYPEQAEQVASVVDVLQVPAFLCRQTDMIESGAKSAKKYNRRLKIKKGQFLSPYETEQIVKKAEKFLPREQILLTERGTSFGYNNLVVDMTSFCIMNSFNVTTIFDATHSVQCPGGLGNASGGKREFVPTLAKAALAAGAQGLFMEVHPRPDDALSDAATCLKLSDTPQLLTDLMKVYQVVNND